jgi:hypothetical protein
MDNSRTYNFYLNEVEQNKFDAWYKKLPKKYKKLEVWFMFSNSSGIGVAVKAIVGDKEIDLTDFESW